MSQESSCRPPRRRWRCQPRRGLGISITAYRGREYHLPHRHSCAQLTIQLAGVLEERLGHTTYETRGTMIGFKPQGALHADRWGHSGALLCTISADGSVAEDLFAGQSPGWRPARHTRELTRLIATLPFVEAAERGERLADLAALCLNIDAQPLSAQPPAPGWLAEIHEALSDDPMGCSISDLARTHDVHRVYLARMFRRSYGCSPTYFRKTQMVARFAQGLARPRAGLAATALDAGFCDQSHANRAFRDHTGFTPGQLRGLFCAAGVSSVQECPPQAG